MRLGTYVGIFALVVGLSACMKKSRVGRLSPQDTELNFSDPTVASVDCPSGVSLGLISTQTHRAGSSSNFIVTASGCKNGYSVSYGGATTPFGRATTDYRQVFNSSPIRVNFTQPGTQQVRMTINILNANTLSPQIVRVLEVSTTVMVEAALPVTCQVSPATVVIPEGQQKTQRFTVSTSVPAKLISVSNAASGGPLVSSPDLSNETIPSVAGPIEKDVTLAGTNGVVNFIVQDGSSPAVQSQPCSASITGLTRLQGVNADFDGDGIEDVASLYKLPGTGAYQLNISYIKSGESISNSILTADLPAAETYEPILAGDINADRKADLIFYRKEGSPQVGKFRVALSSGGTGNADTSFTFFGLGGSWPTNRLLEDRSLDVASNPPRILGKMSGQSYASNLQNIGVAGQAAVGTPEAIVLSANLRAIPSLSVNSGTAVSIILKAQGFFTCELRSCTPKNAQLCDNDNYVANFSPDNPQTDMMTEVGALTVTTQFYSRCLKAGDATPVRNELTVTVLNPNPPPPPSVPQTEYSENFDGVDGVFSSPVFSVPIGSFNRTANVISSLTSPVSILVHNSLSEANVRVEADVNVTAMGAVGLVARYQGPQDKNMYLGGIHAGFGRIYKNVNGTWTELAKKPLSERVGKLVFEVIGNQLVLSFNGQHIVSVADNSIPGPGTAGIRSHGTGSTFDNLKMTKVLVLEGRQVTLPYSDSFEGRDGLFLSDTFTLQAGRIYRSGGKIRAVDPSLLSIISLNGLSAQNVRVSAQVANLTANNSTVELLARYTGSADRNAYMGRLLRSSSTTYAELWVNQGGKWTRLGQKVVAATAGKLSLEVKFNQLFLSLDDKPLLVVSDSTFSAGGSVGLSLRGLGPTVDDFRAEALTNLKRVDVDSRSTAWLDTGLQVTAGKSFSITTSDKVKLSAKYPAVSPNGVNANKSDCKVASGTSFLNGALLGTIEGTGTAFLVGESYSNASPTASGKLLLLVNDKNCAGDNSGLFNSVIQVTP